MITKMLKELERRIGEYSERINKERIKQLKNRKAEIKKYTKKYTFSVNYTKSN